LARTVEDLMKKTLVFILILAAATSLAAGELGIVVNVIFFLAAASGLLLATVNLPTEKSGEHIS